MRFLFDDQSYGWFLSFKKFHEQEKSCTGIKLLNHTDWANQKNINDAQSTT